MPVALGQKVEPRTSKRKFAYTPQPRYDKWVCSKCGRLPVKEKERKKGEPRFELASFRSKADLEQHLAEGH